MDQYRCTDSFAEPVIALDMIDVGVSVNDIFDFQL